MFNNELHIGMTNSVSMFPDSTLLATWTDNSSSDNAGLQMQRIELNSPAWEDICFIKEQTRSGGSFSTTNHLGKYCDISIHAKLFDSNKSHCTSTFESSLTGEVVFDLAGLVISVEGSGSGASTSKCQYYWDKNAKGECNPDFKESMTSFSFDVEGYCGLKIGGVKKLSKIDGINKYSFDFALEADIGPVVGGGYTERKHFYPNGNISEEKIGRFTWGGRGHAKVGMDISFEEISFLRPKKQKKSLSLEGELSLIGRYNWSSYGEFEAVSTLSLLAHAGVFQISATRDFSSSDGWSDWNFYIDGKIFDDHGTTRGEDILTLASAFPNIVNQDIDTISETCQLDSDSVSNEPCTVMLNRKIDNVVYNDISSLSSLELLNGKIACLMSRGEIHGGVQEGRLYCCEIDGKGMIDNVKCIHRDQLE
jgi:hypothetical protein